MTFVYYILAALLIWFSYRSLRGGLDYLNYFEQELKKRPSDYAPFATIVAPCKGLDEGLENNLASLLEQNYSDYEVIFVVDDPDDAAVAVIAGLIKRIEIAVNSTESHPVGETPASLLRMGGSLNAKLVVAPKATESGQKVENLREAVSHADTRSQVFVFVDSDVRPSHDWLRSLVAPLEDTNIGSSTGYRWFISRTATFASELRNIWNASIASALGPNTKDNFCWAGSMAIRRDTFEKLSIREKWRGTLSDDFTVTRAMNAADMPIVFVPQALTASLENCTFREMLEFTTRQMKITRVYGTRFWLLSFFGSGLFCTVMLASVAVIISSRRNDLAVWLSIATILIVSICSIGKSWLRLRAAGMALPRYRPELDRQTFSQCTLWLVSPFIFLINSFSALLSKRLKWRGIEYEMISPNETRIIGIKHGQP